MEASTAVLHTDGQTDAPSAPVHHDSYDGANPEDTTERSDRKEIMARIKKLEFAREAEIFKALGHPIRLKIVYGLLKLGGCNVKKMQECLGLHQATVSQHLIHLKNKGIITSSRLGLEMVYRVSDTWTTSLVDIIDERIAVGYRDENSSQ